MTVKPEDLVSRVCREANEARDPERHARCGGGRVTGSDNCQCWCHKERGRKDGRKNA